MLEGPKPPPILLKAIEESILLKAIEESMVLKPIEGFMVLKPIEGFMVRVGGLRDKGCRIFGWREEDGF